MSWLSVVPGGVRIQVKVQPRSAKNELAGVNGDLLKIRLTAPPVDGKANMLLQKFLGDLFNCGSQRVIILKGATSRVKLVELNGVNAGDVIALVETSNR